MNQEEFEEIFEREFARSREVLVNKAREYAQGDDRLHNFRKTAAFEDQTMEQALWGMQMKHLTSISDMIKTGETYADAMWDEKIGDAINYFILLRAVVADTNHTPKIVNIAPDRS